MDSREASLNFHKWLAKSLFAFPGCRDFDRPGSLARRPIVDRGQSQGTWLSRVERFADSSSERSPKAIGERIGPAEPNFDKFSCQSSMNAFAANQEDITLIASS